MAATPLPTPDEPFRGAKANALADHLSAAVRFLQDADPAATTSKPKTTSTLADGYTVRTRIGPHEIVTDQSSNVGGHDSGPSPVGLALGALGSCQAVTYRMWALQLGIELHSILVDVEADFDPRGLLGVDGHKGPAPRSIRVTVSLDGPDPDRYVELREAVDAHCPVLDLMRNSGEVLTVLGET